MINYNQITNTEFEDVEHEDYPDFCNAFMSRCEVDGLEATEDQLEYINDNLLDNFWDEIYQTLIP